MAVALDRDIGASWSAHLVEIETQSELTRGMTIVDRLNVAHDENNDPSWREALAAGHKADVCWTFDAAGYKAMLMRALK
jgi:inosine-uridine nucleoside N-ribohydrolase